MTNATVRYAAACTGIVVAGVLLFWPLLDGSGRSGAVTAGGLALPVQIIAFAALRRGWAVRRHFLAAWALGMFARVLAVCFALALVLVRGLPPAPTLLGLASFLFAMLLLEPFFLGRDSVRPVRS